MPETPDCNTDDSVIIQDIIANSVADFHRKLQGILRQENLRSLVQVAVTPVDHNHFTLRRRYLGALREAAETRFPNAFNRQLMDALEEERRAALERIQDRLGAHAAERIELASRELLLDVERDETIRVLALGMITAGTYVALSAGIGFVGGGGYSGATAMLGLSGEATGIMGLVGGGGCSGAVAGAAVAAPVAGAVVTAAAAVAMRHELAWRQPPLTIEGSPPKPMIAGRSSNDSRPALFYDYINEVVSKFDADGILTYGTEMFHAILSGGAPPAQSALSALEAVQPMQQSRCFLWCDPTLAPQPDDATLVQKTNHRANKQVVTELRKLGIMVEESTTVEDAIAHIQANPFTRFCILAAGGGRSGYDGAALVEQLLRRAPNASPLATEEDPSTTTATQTNKSDAPAATPGDDGDRETIGSTIGMLKLRRNVDPITLYCFDTEKHQAWVQEKGYSKAVVRQVVRDKCRVLEALKETQRRDRTSTMDDIVAFFSAEAIEAKMLSGAQFVDDCGLAAIAQSAALTPVQLAQHVSNLNDKLECHRALGPAELAALTGYLSSEGKSPAEFADGMLFAWSQEGLLYAPLTQALLRGGSDLAQLQTTAVACRLTRAIHLRGQALVDPAAPKFPNGIPFPPQENGEYILWRGMHLPRESRAARAFETLAVDDRILFQTFGATSTNEHIAVSFSNFGRAMNHLPVVLKIRCQPEAVRWSPEMVVPASIAGVSPAYSEEEEVLMAPGTILCVVGMKRVTATEPGFWSWLFDTRALSRLEVECEFVTTVASTNEAAAPVTMLAFFQA